MGITNKYKVNELAKDFGMQTKQIVEILGKYFKTPKKSGQNLEEKELAVVFEYLTQHNQVSGLDVIYADTAE
ncbi:MAG: translation initiation factor IF-2 N-terminal domain-containing protein, partial [Oscillospiraceae bacterium]|nr:translation initiation factor IF-2 N-terminal domain-containing protein [Oscillospiraceae bacterium]